MLIPSRSRTRRVICNGCANMAKSLALSFKGNNRER